MWVEALAGELGIDTAVVDVQRLLDVARDAAHAVARPSAPLTTFLIGYAVGQAAIAEDGFDEGAAMEAFEQALATATALTASWTEEMPG
ncbi:DUF6457 domain-containing protein [Demequina litorisediminis]|uniref:DUF6457 domain-containing protein n=1 Tax=Demequina litorisediminis TaxID=1849022 RepID=A0ABQ6I979_9MICO|nr:DUF6457 domain-containing protein [Demequina litorisediminis]GMA34271.1 hypothetical protein GCM10025876_04750 [Demequina litorisediminis]